MQAAVPSRDIGPRRWDISRASLKQVASKGANRYLGKDRRVGLITRRGNKDKHLQFARLGKLLRSGRGGNEATGEVRRGCASREKPVHNTALLGRSRGEEHTELVIIRLLLHKQKGLGGPSVSLLSRGGLRNRAAGKRTDSPQEPTVIVLLSSSPTGKS